MAGEHHVEVERAEEQEEFRFYAARHQRLCELRNLAHVINCAAICIASFKKGIRNFSLVLSE